MKLLRQALSLTEQDMSILPPMAMKEIQSNIRKGAQDAEQVWANALELVHKAYSVSLVQRPSPGMTGAWKQYEENITFAVQQLAKSRGMDADWRMSSASLHEATMSREFKVLLDIPGTDQVEVMFAAPDTESVIDMISKQLKVDGTNYEVRANANEDNVELTFWLHGIRDNSSVTITPV